MSAATQIFAESVNHALAGIADHAEAKARARQTQNLAATLDQMELSNAANLAEKQALRVALAKVCPDHPLIRNIALQEKIKEAGRRALSLTNDFDAAREAGGTFKY